MVVIRYAPCRNLSARELELRRAALYSPRSALFAAQRFIRRAALYSPRSGRKNLAVGATHGARWRANPSRAAAW